MSLRGCAVSYGFLNLTTSHSPTISFPPSLSSHFQFPSSSLPFRYFPHPKKPSLTYNKNLTTTLTISCCSSNSHPSFSRVSNFQNDCEFLVVNFYRFVFIEDPQFEVARHLSFLEGLDIHGRIYFNEQGINAQFSGPSRDAFTYVSWLREDRRFSDILVQISPGCNGHAFPRLKLRYKPSLVQFDLGVQGLPLLDPSMCATPLSPAEWRKRLDLLNSDDDASDEDKKKICILLDVRNGYEWDIGHFHGAQRPSVDCFKSTSFGLSDAEVTDSDPLMNVDKDKTDILMYCTGGIRCDAYSTILRQKGFKNLYTLKGGISYYLDNEGPEKWIGNLFVFDSRLSLPPSTFKSTTTNRDQGVSVPSDSKFARCYICDSQVHELRHRNCANLDCNLLFLCCRNCVEELRGCCCSDCKSARRLRPVLDGYGRYEKWHIYRDGKLEQRALSS